MALLIPFNNQPVSNTHKSSSYTIPSGNYAKVTVTNLSSDFEIDSVAVIKATAHTSVGLDTSTTGDKYINPGPWAMIGVMYQSGTASIDITPTGSSIPQPHLYLGTSQAISTATQIAVTLQPGDAVNVTSASAGSVYVRLSAINPMFQTEFWVGPGTDLDGNGYQVALYNIIE